MTDPLGHVTLYAYDPMNRLVDTVYPDGTGETTDYDAMGRVLAKTDPLSHSTEYRYDSLGELTKVIDPLGHTTLYAYTEQGERRSQQDANQHQTTFRIDAFTGRDIGRVLPDGSTETRTNDVAGQVLTRTDFLGRTTRYAYDPMGRLLSRTYPDSSVVSFTYTPNGQRSTETDSRGTSHYAYDVRDRLLQMTYPDGRELLYAYDAHGDRTAITASVGSTSLTTTTTYDPDERPSGVMDPLGRLFTITYDAAGNRSSALYPNGTRTTYAYDDRNRLTNLATTGPAGTVQSYAYTVDAAGRRTQILEADGTERSYGYDSIDRLTSETVAGSLAYAKTFGYDPVGNRLSQTTTGTGAATVGYAYDVRDRLTSETGITYSYDANGNVTTKSGEATYTWDFENRLTSASMASGTLVAQQYDPDGNRVQTNVTPSGGLATTTNMLVDTGGTLSQVVAETDASGNVTAVYVRVGDELREVVRPGSSPGLFAARFVHHDALGSVRALTDESGMTTDTRAYEAFGTKNVETGSDPLTYGFAGEPFQSDSVLAYHRARWMDARVGRFEGIDVVDGDPRHPASLHRYSYAFNEPTSMADPSGNDGVDAEMSFANIFRPVNAPRGTGGPTGPLYPSASLALTQAVQAVLGASQHMPTNTWQGQQSDTQIYAEFGAFVYVLPAIAGKPFGYSYNLTTSGDGGMISDSAWTTLYKVIPAGSTLLAAVHSHPSVEPFQFSHGSGLITYIDPAPDHFSYCDEQFLFTLGSQWSVGFQSDIITGAGHLLVWVFGMSAPYPATALPLNNVCNP